MPLPVSRVFLSLGVLFGLLGGLEVLLRTTHLWGARLSWAQPDPLIGWRFVPGARYWNFQENDHPISGRINSMGWRDREREIQKTQGICRVAVMGDSFVEALQVEQERRFTDLCEDRFRAAGRRIEVWNFGRSGAAQAEQYLLLQNDILPIDPDVVVVLFAPHNDVRDIRRETSPDTGRPYFVETEDGLLKFDASFRGSTSYRWRVALGPLKRRSAFLSLLSERYVRFRGDRQPMLLPETRGGMAPLASLATASPDPEYAHNYLLNKRLLQEIAQTCGSKGIHCLFAVVPYAFTESEQQQWRAADPTFDADFFEHDLRALATASGAELVSLQRAFEGYAGRDERLEWGHWTYRGHEIVAGQVGSALEKLCAAGPHDAASAGLALCETRYFGDAL